MPDLTPFDRARIDAGAASADAAGWLSARQQALLHRRGWLRMLAPRAAGGLEYDLPAVVRLEEQVAAIDGSMGWVLTLCAGAGWFAGFLPPSLAADIIGTPRVCVAGSGAATGFADLAEHNAHSEHDEHDEHDRSALRGPVRLHGRWDYASGAPMATHFTLNAVLRHNGAVLRDAAGKPRIRAFLVPAKYVTVESNWRSMGLKASASQAYRIDGAVLDAAWSFRIDPAFATAPGPLYRFPFMALAYVTLSVNLAGMAAHFIELARAAIARRRHGASGLPLIDVPGVSERLQHASTTMQTSRASFYTCIDAAWATVAAGISLNDTQLAQLKAVSLALAAAARAAVDDLYPYCGLAAAATDQPINRVWRDFHTATQHSLLLPG